MKGLTRAIEGLLILALAFPTFISVSAENGSHEIRGYWATDSTVDGALGAPCEDPGVFLDANTTMKITGPDDEVLAETELEPGKIDSRKHCAFNFSVSNIPDLPEYVFHVNISGIGKVAPYPIDKKTLESRGWSIGFVLDAPTYLTNANTSSTKSNTRKTRLTPTPTQSSDEEFSLVAPTQNVRRVQEVIYANVKESTLFTEPVAMTFISYEFGNENDAIAGFNTISSHAELNLGLLTKTDRIHDVSVGRLGDQRAAYQRSDGAPTLWVVVRQGNQVLSVLALGIEGDYPNFVGDFIEGFLEDIQGSNRSILPELPDMPRGWESTLPPSDVTDEVSK